VKLNIQGRQPGARNLVQEGSSPTVMLHLLMIQKSKLRSWSCQLCCSTSVLMVKSANIVGAETHLKI